MKPVVYMAVLKDLMNRLLHSGFPSCRFEQDFFYANFYADHKMTNPPPISFQTARKSLMANLRLNIMPLWIRNNVIWEKKWHDLKQLYEKKRGNDAEKKKLKSKNSNKVEEPPLEKPQGVTEVAEVMEEEEETTSKEKKPTSAAVVAPPTFVPPPPPPSPPPGVLFSSSWSSLRRSPPAPPPLPSATKGQKRPYQQEVIHPLEALQTQNRELVELKKICYGLKEALRQRDDELRRKDQIMQSQLSTLIGMMEEMDSEPEKDVEADVKKEEEVKPAVVQKAKRFWDPEKNVLDQIRIKTIEQQITTAWEAQQRALRPELVGYSLSSDGSSSCLSSPLLFDKKKEAPNAGS